MLPPSPLAAHVLCSIVQNLKQSGSIVSGAQILEACGKDFTTYLDVTSRLQDNGNGTFTLARLYPKDCGQHVKEYMQESRA